MTTLQRRSRVSLALSVALVQGACGGGSGSPAPAPAGSTASTPDSAGTNPALVEALAISGSVGDGPVVGAEIVVTDAEGGIVEQGTSDGRAEYRLTLPSGTPSPVTVTAAGGTDLVTRRPLDFTLVGAALQRGNVTVNLTVLGTVAVRAAQCAAGGLTGGTLETAWNRVFAELGMGLDRALVADPLGDPVGQATVEAVVLANEALGESVRRTVRALAGSGRNVDGNDVLAQVACELVGADTTPQGGAVDPRVVMVLQSAELGVRLETLARRLRVDDQNAMSALDESIRAIRPEYAEPSVTSVPVTGAGRDRALALMSVLQNALDSERLMRLRVALDGASPEQTREQVDAALTVELETELRALSARLALADRATIDALVERRRRRTAAAAPTVSLAAQPDAVGVGQTTRLSWTSSNADVCVADGGWSGVVPPDGARSSVGVASSTAFDLACVGLGGVARSAVVVAVDGASDAAPEPSPALEPGATAASQHRPVRTPEPEPQALAPSDSEAEGAPQPQPVPPPTASLSAAAEVVDQGAATELRWTSSNADGCTAGGGWRGARAPSGAQSSGALSRATTFSLSCTGSGGSALAMISVAVNGEVLLRWRPPTQNVDGSPLTDLEGYRIHFGERSRVYTRSIDLMDPDRRSYALTLPSGSYHLAMTAVDASGNESAYSNEVLRTVD